MSATTLYFFISGGVKPPPPPIPVCPEVKADRRPNYREWLRIRLNVPTPVQVGIPGAVLGDALPYAPNPDNYKLNSAIRTAAQIVDQHVGLASVGVLQGLPITPQSAVGPYSFYLGGVPCINDRAIISIRRAWWNDGVRQNNLDRVILSELDRVKDQYMNSPPGVPRRFAIEGYYLYLDPPPSSPGTFQFMASCGVLAPQDDTVGFDAIPESYDPAVLYIALVELGKMTPNDQEMSARAQAFAGDAQAGLERLSAWFFGGANQEVLPSFMPDISRWRRGYARR